MNKTALSITLLALSAPSVASLGVGSDPNWGVGSLTEDTSTGLAWLTPITTSGLAFSKVRDLLNTDARYAGFRVARTAELVTLFTSAGIPEINTPGYGALYGTTSNVAGVGLLQSMIGITYQYQYSGFGFLYETSGYVDDEFRSPINGLPSVNIGNVVLRTAVITGAGTYDFASAYSTWGSVPIGSALVGVGTWLVKQQVPEPQSIFIVSLALAVCLSVRRR